MYKVFFNEQIIYIDSKKDSSLSNSWQEIVTQEEIPKVLFEFFKNEENLYLYSENPDTILSWFSSEIEYIEAAGGIVENDDEELLFIYRLEYWDLPKGGIEADETPEEAAYREIKEECGIYTHQLKQHLTDTYHIYERESKMYLKKTFWFYFEQKDLTEEVNPQTEEDIDLVSWFADAEIELALLDSYESIREVYKAYREMN